MNFNLRKELKYFTTFTSAILLVIISACTSSKTSEVDINYLLSSPDSLIVNDTIYKLNVYLWRDLMPTIDTPRSGLNLSIRLSASVEMKSPADYHIDKVWVIEGNEIWLPKVLKTESSGYIEYYAHNGPLWKVNKTVNLIAEIIINGNRYQMKASNIKIQAVY